MIRCEAIRSIDGDDVLDAGLVERQRVEEELREELISLGVITERGRELLGGCIVIPIPDALTGEWTSLYGRGLRADRHCYLMGSLMGAAAMSFFRLWSTRIE